MAELQVLSPLLRANQEANAERILAVNNPNISRRRFVASHLYAMCTMFLLCITTIIITLIITNDANTCMLPTIWAASRNESFSSLSR